MLLLIGSAVIWSKLRLVGDVPRRAFAEPGAVDPGLPPRGAEGGETPPEAWPEPSHPVEPWRERWDESGDPVSSLRVS